VSFQLAEQYCIDGQRLFLTKKNTQRRANQSEYTVNGGLYSSIIAHGSLDAAPDYFEVTNDDGNMYTFGSDIKSRILVSQSNVVHTWLLSSVKDKDGKAATLEYDTDSDYRYLLAIRYHGMSVEFSYANRNDSVTPRYFNGSILYTMVQEKVLSAATSYTKPNSIYRDLRLNHESSGSASFSLHMSYDLCDSDNGCISLTNFTYDGSVDVIGLKAMRVVHNWTSQYTFEKEWEREYLRLPSDVNGDGMKDIVGFGDNNIWMSLNTHRNYCFSYEYYNQPDLCYGKGWTVENSDRNLADLNGDGLADIYGFNRDGVRVAINGGILQMFDTPSTTWTTEFSYNKNYPMFMKDVNGDGLPDIIHYGDTSVQVAINTGSSFQAAKVVSREMMYSREWRVEKHPRFVEDVNGDGRPDLVGIGGNNVYVALNIDGESFTPADVWSSEFGHQFRLKGEKIHTKPYLSDVNGDGLPDITGFFGPYVVVALNTGSSFTLAKLWHHSSRRFNRFYKILLNDMNGDRLADVVGFDCCGIQVVLNTGHSFKKGIPPRWISGLYGSIVSWNDVDYPTFVTDVNGDGVADIIGFGHHSVPVAVNQNRRISLKMVAGGSGHFLDATKCGASGSITVDYNGSITVDYGSEGMVRGYVEPISQNVFKG
jgi:hypothetical protein